MFAEDLIAKLRTECRVAEGQQLLLGVSGGPDSMAMLHALKCGPWALTVGHFDHQIRPSAQRDAELVAAQCSAWGVGFVLGRADVPAIAQDQGLGLEETARQERYRFLFSQAEALGAAAVVVAHNHDDHLETMLMHFLRGSGLEGLRGLSCRRVLPIWHKTIPLLRPMLDQSRQAVLDYCSAKQIPFVTDETNADTRYYRNRLRLELMPLLDGLNPAWRKNLSRNAQVVEGELEILDGIVSAEMQGIATRENGAYLVDREGFLALALPLQRRVVLRCLKELQPDLREIGFDQAQALCQAILDGRRGMHLGDGLQMRLNGKQVRLALIGYELAVDAFPQLAEGAPVWLAPGEEVQLGAWRMSTEVLEGGGVPGQVDQWQADLPYGEQTILLRPASVGERLQPIGMQGRQKISDIFINQKVPEPYRKNWPLLCLDEGPAWLVGLRLDERYRLRGHEKKVLRVTLRQDENY